MTTLNQETEATTNVPATIDYNPSDVEAGSKRAQLRLGWFKGVVTKPARNGTSSGKGLLMQTLQIKPLDINDMPVGSGLSFCVFPPQTNPQTGASPTKGKNKEENWAVGKCQGYLHATNPTKFPYFPRKVDSSTYELADGSHVTPEESKAVRKTLENNIWEEMKQRWVQTDRYEGETMFFKIGLDDRNPEYRNIVAVSAKLPEGETLITENFTGGDEVEEDTVGF